MVTGWRRISARGRCSPETSAAVGCRKAHRHERQDHAKRQQRDEQEGAGEGEWREEIGADGREARPDDGRHDAARQDQRDRLGPERIVRDLGRGEAQMQRRGVGSAKDRVADAEQDEAVLINRGHAERTAGRADQGADEEGVATADQPHQMRDRDGGRHRDHELKSQRHGREPRIGGEHLSREGGDGRDHRGIGIRQSLGDGEQQDRAMLGTS